MGNDLFVERGGKMIPYREAMAESRRIALVRIAYRTMGAVLISVFFWWVMAQ